LPTSLRSTPPAGTAPTAPGGVALVDHDTFEVIGPWEKERGDQWFGYEVWWHLRDDVAITSPSTTAGSTSRASEPAS